MIIEGDANRNVGEKLDALELYEKSLKKTNDSQEKSYIKEARNFLFRLKIADMLFDNMTINEGEVIYGDLLFCAGHNILYKLICIERMSELCRQEKEYELAIETAKQGIAIAIGMNNDIKIYEKNPIFLRELAIISQSIAASLQQQYKIEDTKTKVKEEAYNYLKRAKLILENGIKNGLFLEDELEAINDDILKIK